MKKRISICIAICFVVLFVVNSSYADLNLLGQGTSTHGTYNLIYDTDLDITWYDYTSSSYQATWQNQVDWTDALSVTFGSNVYDDWRLPTALDQDGTGPCNEYYNCSDSEMGHLYYIELENTRAGLVTNSGDFQSLLSENYWTSTEFNANEVWLYSYDGGYQYHDVKGGNFYAIAVRDGLAVVPEPVSSTLFIVGGAFIAGQHYSRKKTGHNKTVL